ncbi:MAG: hypothetical protein H6697_01020 [Myxococcales bacterium]|nr:hypothetical protein [Myxococcales bacterium]
MKRLALLVAAASLAACHTDHPSHADAEDVAADLGSDADAADASDGSGGVDVDVDAADGSDDATPVLCVPEPTAAALVQPGEVEGDTQVGLGGRALEAYGPVTELAGFPSHTVINAAGTRAYVLSTSTDDRRLYVVDLANGEVLDDESLGEAYYGLVLDEAGGWIYASGGANRTVLRLALGADGLLGETTTQDVATFASGLALSIDRSRLYVGSGSANELLELDTATFGAPEAITARRTTTAPVWAVEVAPGSGLIVTSTLGGSGLDVFSPEAGGERRSVPVGRSPAGVAISSDGAFAWVAVSGADQVARIDLSTLAITHTAPVGDADLVDADGAPLLRSNPNDVALSADGTRIYVPRGSDNAVSVFSAADLAPLGTIPTRWYPTGAEVTPGGDTLVILEGKGAGSGPNASGQSSKSLLDGGLVRVALTSLDLEASTAAAIANFNRSRTTFPFDCVGTFPVPRQLGDPTPIEHVILVVKENKTFDCVFGDLGDGFDTDPTLVRWGEDITPNQHALAREFTIADNFYDEVEASDMGHITLTNGFLTDFAERIWMEAVRSDSFQGFQIQDPTTPSNGNLFTHIHDHGRSVRTYGEIVGMFARAADGWKPIDNADDDYPGGLVFNMNVQDESRAQYVVDRINAGDLADFTFMLLPNDHTGGSAPGNPTPEAEVADNDRGVGVLIEGLSQSEYWENTVVFVVEDDPQGCGDHVDSHRSFAFVISPWARRGYVSHVNYSFQSVFATVLQILGVPPMGRPDASASPMYDMFTATPDFTPFEALARTVPEDKILDIHTPGARESMRMDFSGPDRNADLGIVLDAYRLWRMGHIERDEAHRRIELGIRTLPGGRLMDADDAEELREEQEEEREEEGYAFDAAMAEYRAWAAERGVTVPELRGGPIPEATIDALYRGELRVEDVARFER